jgi:1-hydroxycarotenoid 3,4-desaturase
MTSALAKRAQAPHVVIIGGGVGGLSTAIRLLGLGYRVTVLERAATPGGKMRQLHVAGQSFDGGPSVLTLPWVLDELCAVAGVERASLIKLTPLDPLCRHFFADGTQLDLFNDDPPDGHHSNEASWARSSDEIRRVIGSKAAEEYGRFRRHAARIYHAVERPFLRTTIPSNPLGLLFLNRVSDVMGLWRIDALRTLWGALGRYFSDERLRMLFARYATYSGADPFQAPGTLAVIPHVEQGFGVFAVEGGMYQVALALADLVTRMGGQLRYRADVSRLTLDAAGRRVLAAEVAGELIHADLFVANCDGAQLYERMLDASRVAERLRKRYDQLPPSLSACLHLAVAQDAGALPLAHHNVFFTHDYRQEFRDLRDGPPSDPTVYLCNPDYAHATQRWFFLTNAPALPRAHESSQQLAWNDDLVATCRRRVADKLSRHGIDYQRHVTAEGAVTPEDFAQLFPSSRGAIYGAAASSRVAAFRRPPNQLPGLSNLFCVGGSTHPGAGVPMVMLSAQIVAGLIARRFPAGQPARAMQNFQAR